MRAISPEDHLAFLRSAALGELPADPRLGRGEVGVAARVARLVRRRASWSAPGWCSTDSCPGSSAFLAYLPEGPVLDWSTDRLGDWLAPLAAYLKEQGAFGVRMGPPVVTRRWSAAQVKEGLADPAVRKLADLPPTERDPVGARVVSQLTSLGWRPQGTDEGFAARPAAVRLPGPARRPRPRPTSSPA